MKVDLPDIAAAAGLTPDEAHLRLAFSLYRDARLSTNQCAELACLDRRTFLDDQVRHLIESPYNLADIQSDLATLDKLAAR